MGKSNTVLCLIKHLARDAGGMEVSLHAFLTSALDGGECSASLLGPYTPRVRAPGTHWVGGWMSPRAGLDAMGRRQIPISCPESNFGSPARGLATILSYPRSFTI